MNAKILSLADVSKLIGKRPHQITYAITSGLVTDVATRIAGKRVFTWREVEVLKKHFGTKKEDK